MAVYRRVFSFPSVGTIHEEFVAAIATFEAVEAAWAAAGKPGVAIATVDRLRLSYLEFNRSLDAVARDTSVAAKARIVGILKLRQKRPGTGLGPHLAGAIRCRPIKDFGNLGTGEVGIADIATLDAVVNPFGPQYGPYWRAIELGTRRHVGRQVVGAFFGTGLSGGPFAPDPSQFRAHPVFVTSSQGADVFGGLGFGGGFGVAGGKGGRRMTIRRAIDPEYFIRDGATLASREWRARMLAVEDAAIRQLRPVTAP